MPSEVRPGRPGTFHTALSEGVLSGHPPEVMSSEPLSCCENISYLEKPHACVPIESPGRG